MKIQKTQQGSGIVKVLVSIPLVLVGLVILTFAYTELNKAYQDYRVKLLCEKDGGVSVFEVVELTHEEYILNGGNKGGIRVMPERTSIDRHQYAYKSVNTTIKDKSLVVWRSEYVTYRKSDNLTLGKYITFTRRGGDFPTIVVHPSSFSCRDIEGFETDVLKKIFLVKGDL